MTCIKDGTCRACGQQHRLGVEALACDLVFGRHSPGITDERRMAELVEWSTRSDQVAEALRGLRTAP